jgi:glycosyltransferase involved in cell wall biosynthesis
MNPVRNSTNIDMLHEEPSHKISNGVKVLMLSGDRNILTQGIDAHARLELQRAQVEQLDVFVWPQIHSWREVYTAATTNTYDVITAQDPFWRGLLAWRLARRTGAKLNVQVHTDLDAQPFLRRALARIVLRYADSVRAVSGKIQKQVERFGVHAPIRVLPIFIELEQFRTLERKPHVQKTLLWLGRFESEKNPILAISVLEQVRLAGLDARLVMLGAGSMEREMRKRAANLPVEFPGWQDPKPYLQTADVVLSTSLHESWGASIVEALAAGVPVVAPDVGIAREAGANIADRSHLAEEVIGVLHSDTRGELKLSLLDKDEWAKRWKQTLV